MRHKILQATFLAMLFALLLLSAPPAVQARQCSQTGSAGSYAFTLTGVVILPTGPVPIAAVGRADVDAAGNVIGTEARSVGGGFAEETLTGTLTVNADCTGVLTARFYESGQLVRTSVLATVFDDNRKELRMVQKSLVLPNNASLPVVITVQAKRIFTEDD